jgi:hypothetical protein
VYAHSRADGRLMGTAVSDPVTGAYNIMVGSDQAYVVAIESNPSFNGMVVDWVTPS